MLNNLSINDLLRAVREYNEDIVYTVKKAYDMASTLHQNQYRKSGEPYIIHPLNVCYTLALMHADCDTLCAALLHDTLEDTHVTKEEIAKEFNDKVAELVDGVTKISNSRYLVNDDNLATTRKIIGSMTKDIRIIMIKLADRLHNMRTLEFKSPYKQEEISLETMHIYVPLAHLIGAHEIKYELEDIAFRYLKLDDYLKTEEKRNAIIADSEETLKMMTNNIKNELDKKNIESFISNKIKNIYGIYKRINMLGDYIDAHDVVALKVCLNEVSNCYLALGLIHEIYKPVNEKIKDYICRPKTNMYQALHTTVFAPNDLLIQVRLKTHIMNLVSTNGLSSYWYFFGDEARVQMQQDLKKKCQFYNSLEEINQVFPSNKLFVEHAGKEILSEKVYVFTTTNGLLIELPKGSTIIDYVFKVYKERAKYLEKVLVNGKEVPVSYVLNNNDIIRVTLNPLATNDLNAWENIAYTTTASKLIRKII